jgi:RNA 3'-terminal phosphate cyclase (ATP)
MGPRLSVTLERHGFFPRGGGRIVLEIGPAPLAPIACTARGAFRAGKAEALIAGIPFDIADRELKAARKVLADWPEDAFAPVQLPADHGPGNALLITVECEHVTEVMSAFGQIGIPAERLAKTAAQRISGYLASGAFAGPYLQDQLLLPFALAGAGAFTTVKLSEHTRTAIQLIARFTGRQFAARATDDGVWLVKL